MALTCTRAWIGFVLIKNKGMQQACVCKDDFNFHQLYRCLSVKITWQRFLPLFPLVLKYGVFKTILKLHSNFLTKQEICQRKKKEIRTLHFFLVLQY